MTSKQYCEARLRMGLTQSSIAAELGMTQQMVARIESGARQPTRQQAAAIRNLELLLRRTTCNYVSEINSMARPVMMD